MQIRYFTRVLAAAFTCVLMTVSAKPASAAVLGGITDIEPTNNTSAGAGFVSFSGQGVTRAICTLTPGDVDYFTFNTGFLGPEGAYLIMTTPLESLPTNFSTPDTIIEVFNPSGTLIAFDDDGGSDSIGTSARGSIVRFKPTSGGSHRIRVRGFNATTAGRYMITFAQVNLLDSVHEPHWVSDFENGPMPNVDHLDLQTFHMMHGLYSSANSSDLDHASFDMNAGDVLTISAVGVSQLEDATPTWSSPDMTMSILDTNGVTTLVTNVNDSAGQVPGGTNSGVGSTIRFRAPATGRYFLKLQNTAGAGFSSLTTSYLPAQSCEGDADGNGVINFSDITSVLANFNTTCP